MWQVVTFWLPNTRAPAATMDGRPCRPGWNSMVHFCSDGYRSSRSPGKVRAPEKWLRVQPVPKLALERIWIINDRAFRIDLHSRALLGRVCRPGRLTLGRRTAGSGKRAPHLTHIVSSLDALGP